MALGAWNRQRARRASQALAAAGARPGAAGVELRRSLRAELVPDASPCSQSPRRSSPTRPPVGATGPVSADATLGPARLELTVDPARVGRNQIHLYLFDRRSGRQWDRAEGADRHRPAAGQAPSVRCPSTPRKAGPGHYVIRRADLAPKATGGST